MKSKDKVRSYASITPEEREIFLLDPRVIELRDAMPSDVAQLMTEAFIQGDHTSDVKDVYDYFIHTSDIARAIVAEKGGAKIFYYLYNKEGSGPLDRYYLKSGAGHQIYRRLVVMVETIPIILRRLFPSGNILVDNIASGYGDDMLRVLANPKNTDLRKRVHVRNIDPNQEALDYTWQEIKKHGLEDNFENICSTMTGYSGRRAHIMIGSGIFCSFTVALCVRTVKNDFTRFIRTGGYCLYNATTVKMIHEDPFTDFTMRLLGWSMGFKTTSDINSIATRSGWNIDSVFFDTDDNGKEVGYNQMVVAKKT